MKIPFRIRSLGNGILDGQPVTHFEVAGLPDMSICAAHGVDVLVIVYGGKPCPFCNPVEVANGNSH